MSISSILFYVDHNYIVIVYYLYIFQCLRITTPHWEESFRVLDFGVLKKDSSVI